MFWYPIRQDISDLPPKYAVLRLKVSVISLFNVKPTPGARPTKHISIEFEIRWKFKTL